MAPVPPSSWQLVLPSWLTEVWAASREQPFATVGERVSLAIELASRNVREGTGGPFGAAVFAGDRLVAPGINLVESSGTSIAHAEIVAILLAQQQAGGYDLSAETLPPHELASSAEPCAMCLGAIPWSGLRSLVFAARDEDIRAIGFDEGHKPTRWIEALEERGIRVMGGVERERSRAVLDSYARGGARIYNPRRG